MKILWIVGLFAISSLAYSQAPVPCTLHSCSNDVDGVYGDEVLVWDPVEPTPTRYQIFRELPESWIWWKMHCMDVPGNQPTALLSNSKCLRSGPRVLIYVRACVGSICGDLSNPVEFRPPVR